MSNTILDGTTLTILVSESAGNGTGTFQLDVPFATIEVTPNANGSWAMSYNNSVVENITVQFEGDISPLATIYQAAAIRFTLPAEWTWFTNGIGIIAATHDDGSAIPSNEFDHFLNLENPKDITLTMQMLKKVLFSGHLNFRFKAIDADPVNGSAQVYVSDDPTVRVRKPGPTN